MKPRGAAVLGLLVFFSSCFALVNGFGDEAADAKDRTRQTLLYGIDSQVLDTVQSIMSAQDQGFTPELVQILNGQRSPELQKAVFDLFRAQKIRDGEERGKAVLASWQDSNEALLVAAIQYLASLPSAGLSTALSPLVDAGSNVVAIAAIQALGTAGDKTAAPLLAAKLKSTDFPDARKNDCILALGALKDPAAVDVLLSIAKSTDEDKVRRMYAADSLGKIGDPRALPVLRTMFAENDALIRLYAAGALSHFGMEEVFPSIVQGLRDGNVRVREQSAKALARPLSSSQADAAVPILSYKAELDPEPSVRVASIQALGAIGGDKAMSMLMKIYSGADHPLDSRETALGILASHSLSASMEAIRAVVAKEWTSFDPRTLESTAKVLSTIKSADLKDLFVRFLDSHDPVVRSYGVRGIGANGFSDLKDRVKKISEQDPNSGTRQEAARSLAKL
ncbi:MAG: HEAT repeat domain-containing protein [Spirochaetia bacterium]